ncbi:peptidyl-prolyl cis-trans isomerase [Stemphylium lycopersici]|uniref:peptidylprolyl isomerase n=1 Tax=Stemphylium lycopersici TaxID=183478 RepID=A0A364N1E8_STELY|nr:fkbp-type peptidyl-prolyl isomerase [Stemphylium lycopersici]RAR01864.1 peptidyl-prolyl cis-trans isomerase [Stemphylium lycopersici]RAR09450.1 peptidyl-prolyl cis-trans isomerase [Stemphylium lycopersici]
MGVEKIISRPGNGTDFPRKHDEISVEYTGWLFDDDAPDHKGTQFDSSLDRGDLTTPIGAGRVIRGWDEGILGSEDIPPMSLGEIATLIITPDYAYGTRGFPGHIPANAKLIFEVELKAINGKRE